MADWGFRLAHDETRKGYGASGETETLEQALDEGWKMHRVFQKPVEIIDRREDVDHVAAIIQVEWVDE